MTPAVEVHGGNSAGLYLTLEELSALFPLLKNNEERMGVRERQILNRMERILYEHLSIEEIENRIRGSVGYG
ncbi:MAG: hypothetical protein LBB72_09425 [Spirochaetaceae bacterium]|nr:hypothetical protein [Spirochaetaceae bacterium]